MRKLDVLLLLTLCPNLLHGEDTPAKPDTDAPKAATLLPRAGGGYGAAAFSFRLGIRSDAPDAKRLTRNNYDLQFRSGNGDTFDILMVTDDRSRILDLGAMVWADLKEVPALTPLPSLDTRRPNLPAQVGHLYVVHTKDRDSDFYTVFRVEALVPGTRCDLTWKRVPAPPPLAPPAGVTVSRDGKDVTVSWKPATGAKAYCIQGPGEEKPLLETEACQGRLPGLLPDAVHLLKISTLYPNGEASEPVEFEVHTHPDDWKSGMIEINVRREGLSFSKGQATKRGSLTELMVVDSAGGGDSLIFSAPSGIARSGTAGCAIPQEPPNPFAKRYQSDFRFPASESLLVHCPGGGLAAVSILGRDFPKVRFLYLYRPPSPAMSPPDEEEAAGIRKIISRMDDPAYDEREKASQELVALGIRAQGLVDEALKGNPSPELRERLEAWRRVLGLNLVDEIDGAAEIRGTCEENGRDGGW